MSQDSIGVVTIDDEATGMEDNSEAKPLAQMERHSYNEMGYLETKSSRPPVEENFFLDIPFYRTH